MALRSLCQDHDGKIAAALDSRRSACYLCHRSRLSRSCRLVAPGDRSRRGIKKGKLPGLISSVSLDMQRRLIYITPLAWRTRLFFEN
ncbi:protein of unknown function [Candidatus Nitrospira inopinata]|uniref:Uncharacterized protein n=1 Tax=Candidatus Nitrospira inopinata TaxID=1715989 RepID=A0A0S4KQU7_9BACT|nr:protein of unknown function [Candidatus Nitrospira inopinata]